jgi:hypothetical protein
LFAELPAVLVRDAHGVLPFLGNTRVIHDEIRVVAAEHLIGAREELVLERRGVPLRGGDEVMQLLLLARGNALCDRLDALAFTRPEKPEQGRSPALC